MTPHDKECELLKQLLPAQCVRFSGVRAVLCMRLLQTHARSWNFTRYASVRMSVAGLLHQLNSQVQLEAAAERVVVVGEGYYCAGAG